MKQDSNLGSDFFQNLLKEQEKLEHSIKQLGSIKESFNDEISKIKNQIPNLINKSPSKNDNLGGTNELRVLLGVNFSKMRDKILSIDEIQRIERLVRSQVISIVEETQSELSHSLSNLAVLGDNLSPTAHGVSSSRKFDDICRSNENIFKSYENSFETMRKKILSSFNETDTKAIAFNKDSQHLRENYELARNQILSLIKESKSEASRYTSPNKTDSHLKDNMRRIANTLDQALTEIINSDLKKNKTFMAFKEEFDNLGNRCRHFIKEVTLNNEQLKNNVSSLSSQIEESRTLERMSKTGTADMNRKSSRQTNTFNDKFSPYRSKTRQEEYSAGRNYNSRSVSPMAVKGGDFHSRSNKELKYGENEVELANQLSRSKNDFEELRREYDSFVSTINLKIGHVRTSSRNLIISATKISKFLEATSVEEELALNVFENDKKVFDTYVNSIGELLTTQARSPVSRARSQSIENLARKDPSPQKKSSTAQNFYKPSAEDLKAKESRNSDSGKKRLDASEFEDSNQVNQLKTDVKALRYDLASTKAKLEKTALEKAHLKDEYNNLVQKVKNKGLPTNYVDKIKELSEQNENLQKENQKLQKNSKKLEQKADERKKNLKQLFELLEEKEKELGFYKAGSTVSVSNQAIRLEDLIKEKSIELESQYQALEQQIKEKSDEVDRLTSIVASISLNFNVLNGRDIDTATFRGENTLTARREERIDTMTEKVIEFDKKRQKLEDLLTNSMTSPSKQQEIREMISFLNKEKESLIHKIKAARSTERDSRMTPTQLEREINEVSSPVMKNLSREKDFLKDLADKQDLAIQQLKIEKQTIENRLAEVQEDLKASVEHRKRVEKNYQDNITILNKKIQEQAKIIDELSPPSKSSNDDFFRELHDQASRELFTLNTKINELLEFTGDFKEDYADLKPITKVERALNNMKRKESEKRKDSPMKKDMTSPKGFTYTDSEKKQNNDLERTVENLKASSKQLEKERDEAKNEVLLKENEIKKLKLDLQAKGLSNEEQIKQMKTLEVSKNKAQGEIDTLFAKLSGLALRYKLGSEEEIKTSYQILEKIEMNLRDQLRAKDDIQARSNLDGEAAKLKKEFKDKEKSLKDKIKELEGTISSQEDTIESLKQDMGDKDIQLRELNERVNNLRELDNSNKEELEDKEREIEELRTAKKNIEAKQNESVNSLTQEKNKYKEEISSLQLKNEGLSQLKNQLETQLEKLKKEKRELESQVEDLNAKHSEEVDALQQAKEQQLKQKLQLMEMSLTEAKKEAARGIQELNEKYSSESDKLKQKIQSLNQQISQLKDEINVLTNSNNQLVEEVRTKEDEIQEIRDQQNILLNQKRVIEENLRSKTREYEAIFAQYESLQNSSSSSTHEIEKKYRDLSAEKLKLLQEVDSLSIQLQSEQTANKNSKNTIQTLEKKIEGLNANLSSHGESHSQAIQELEDIQSRLEDDNASLNAKIAENEKQLNDLSNKLKSSNEIINSYKESLAQKEDKIKELEQERDVIEEQRNEFENRLNSNLKNSASKSDTLRVQLDHAQRDIDLLNKQLKESKDQNTQLSTHVHDLESKLKVKSTETQDLQESLAKIQNEKARLESEHQETESDLNNKIAELSATITDYENKSKHLKADLQKVNSDLNAIKGEREALLAEKSLLNQETSKATQEISSKISEYESQLQNARTQIETLENDLNEKVENLSQLQKQIDSKDKKIHELNESIRNIEANYSQNLDQIKSEMRELENQNNWLHEELDNKNSEAKSLSIKVLDKENEISDLNTKIRDLEEQIAQKSGDMDEQMSNLKKEYTEKKRKLKQNVSDLQNKVSEYEKERLELANKIVTVNHELESSKKEIESLNQILTEAKSESHTKIEELRGHLKDAHKEKEQLIKSHSQEVERLTNILHEKEQELDNLGSNSDKRIQRLQEEFSSKKAEAENLTSELSRSNEKTKLIESNLERVQAALKSIESENSNLADELNKFRANETRTGKAIEDLKSQKKDLEDKEKNLHSQIAELNTKLQESISRVEELETAIESKNNELKAKQEELTKNEEKIEDLNSKLIEAESKLNAKSEENEKAYQAQIKQLQTQITELNQENEFNQTANSKLTKEVNDLNNGIEERDKTINAMEADLKELEHEKEKLHNEIALSKNAIIELGNRRFFKENNIFLIGESSTEDLIKNFGRGLSEYDNEINLLREQITSLTEKQDKKIELASQNVEKDKAQLEKNITTMQEETIINLKKVNYEIEKIMTEFLDDDDIITDQNQKITLDALEKAVFENLSSLRQVVRAYKDINTRYVKIQAELETRKKENEVLVSKLARLEEREKSLAKENEELQTKSGQLADIVKKTESEIEEFKKSYSKDKPQIDQREISLNIPEDLDDVKVKSFLEESVRVDRTSQDKIEGVDEEYIRSLRDQVRELQDQNEQLINDNKAIRSEYDMLRIMHDELKQEIIDHEENTRNMEIQLNVIKKEFQDMENQKTSSIAHEKAHLRQIFQKFMDSAIKNTKDAPPLFVTFLSLLDMTEKEKNDLTASFKAQTSKKGGVFGKLFKD